jgi:hypothetical protein
MTPIRAIRAFCLDCCGGSSREVTRCSSPKCPLFEYREGHNPAIQREYTDEQRAILSERMKAYKAKNP